MAKSQRSSKVSARGPPPAVKRDIHVRYAILVGEERFGAEYVGHSGGCLGTPIVPFENARVWARRQDAAHYLRHRNVADIKHKLHVIPVTCAVGEPYVVLTQ